MPITREQAKWLVECRDPRLTVIPRRPAVPLEDGCNYLPGMLSHVAAYVVGPGLLAPLDRVQLHDNYYYLLKWLSLSAYTEDQWDLHVLAQTAWTEPF